MRNAGPFQFLMLLVIAISFTGCASQNPFLNPLARNATDEARWAAPSVTAEEAIADNETFPTAVRPASFGSRMMSCRSGSS